MNCTEYRSTVDLPDEEFTAIHKEYLGISQLGAVAGLTPWFTPIMVYLEKLGELPEEDNKKRSERMYWGKKHESAIADRFAEETHLTLINPEMIYRHNKLSFLLGTPDRLITTGGVLVGVLEIKTTDRVNKKQWEGDLCPLAYELQCRMYMHFFNVDTGYVACLLGGNELLIREFTRDIELENYALSIAVDFWENHVEKKFPPPLLGTDSESDAIGSMFPEIVDEIKIVDESYARLFNDYIEEKEKLRLLDLQVKALENEIKLLIGENIGINIGGTVIRYPMYQKTLVDSDRLKRELPAVFSKYRKVSKYRQIRL